MKRSFSVAPAATPALKSLFRQHFTDFYGDLPSGEVQRLIAAERRELEAISAGFYRRALLRDTVNRELFDTRTRPIRKRERVPA